MPSVGLKFYANLRRYAPPGRERETTPYEVRPGTTVGELIVCLGIDDGEDFAIVVGNRIVTPETELRDGDTVLFLPPVAGGQPIEAKPSMLLMARP